MSTRKKIDKLEKKMHKMRIKKILAVSDLRIELESETYRANIAETKVRNLVDELNVFKLKLAKFTILQRAPVEQSDTTEIKDINLVELAPK